MKKLVAIVTALVMVVFLGMTPASAIEAPYLSGKHLGGGQVLLSWSHVPDASSYQIFYGPADNPHAHGVVTGSVTSYTVGSLFRNISYRFSVKAVRDGQVSALSNTAVVRTSASGRAPLPAQPQPQVGSQVNGKVVTPAVSYNQAADTMRTDAGLNDPHISSGKPGVGHMNLRTSRGPVTGSVTLHWNQPNEHNVGEYNIVYTDDPAVEKWGVRNIPTNLRSYTVKALDSGKRYWFWMSSDNTGQTPFVSDLAR